MIDLRAVIDKLAHTEAHLDPGMSEADADEHRGNVRDALAALEAMLPEEREGACSCGWCFYRDRADNKRGWYCGDTGTAPCENYCPRCGAELCADGIARRHPDAGRVERVREALDAARGARGSEDYRDGITTTVLNIRAALDGPQGGGKAINADRGGLAAIVGQWPGDETDEEIAEALADLRPEHPDTRRAALEADAARVERVDSALKIACKSLAESDCADTLCIAGECPKVALVVPCPQEPVADCDDEYAAACWRLHFLGLADAALDAPQGGGTDE